MLVASRWRAICFSDSSYSLFPACRKPASSPLTHSAPSLIVSSWLMQRKNVLLPEPDGPMMHSTSPWATSSVMPLSASNSPYDLRTPEARTIELMSVPSTVERSGGSLACGRAARAARITQLDARLQERQHGHDDEIPDARDDQQFDHACVRVIDVLRVVQHLGVLNDARERGQLDHADQFVTDRRDDDAHGLRQDHAPQRLQAVHADRFGRFVLAGVHR